MYTTFIIATYFILAAICNVSLGVQCPMWREILPCQCLITNVQSRLSTVTCEKMSSYEQVVNIFRGHFTPSDRVSLKLEKSNLQDLQYRSFKELNVTIEKLRLNHNYLGILTEETFDGLSRVDYISLADSPIETIPGHLWKKMPYIHTADFGRTKIREILIDSFWHLQDVKCIVLPGNDITRMDKNSIPLQIERLHIGRNRIRHLNDTLLALKNLRWLFLNSNELENLEGQLPIEAPQLKLIHASSNRLTSIPKQLKNYQELETLFLCYNQIETLDGALAKTRALQTLMLEYNLIHTITIDDFAELQILDTLTLAHNQITTLNSSLLPLKNLSFLNFTYNLLTEFSFQEIMGLEKLKRIDLSYNQISHLVGSAANLVESNIKLLELKLDHNLLETLDSALSGLSDLLRLDLSNNKLRRISPDDFINLDQLRLLDISSNQLTTLDEMSKTYLPRLQELKAGNNYLTVLEHDFQGLPVLCNADLSNNKIVSLGRELVTKTRCKIDHGIHEGAWDTLKIYLQGNPILCDAALPEITSEMETNHTRIFGVSNCPPLSEEPVTSKPTRYLGIDYTSEQSPYASKLPLAYNHPASYDRKPVHSNNMEFLETRNQIPNKVYSESDNLPSPLGVNSHYHTIDRYQEAEAPLIRQPRKDDQYAAVTPTSPKDITTNTSSINDSSVNINNITDQQTYDPVLQGKVINKLVTEIEELKTRIEQISTQNERFLNKTGLATKIP